MKDTRTLYVVSHRGRHDDKFFSFSHASMLGSSRHEAWMAFLDLCGGSRDKWNKLGYIAVPVKVTVDYSNEVME